MSWTARFGFSPWLLFWVGWIVTMPVWLPLLILWWIVRDRCRWVYNEYRRDRIRYEGGTPVERERHDGTWIIVDTRPQP